MIHYTATVDAPHSESGTQQRKIETTSVNELMNAVAGLARDHLDTAFTFTITATEIQEG